jgi:hypothetical protein
LVIEPLSDQEKRASITGKEDQGRAVTAVRLDIQYPTGRDLNGFY